MQRPTPCSHSSAWRNSRPTPRAAISPKTRKEFNLELIEIAGLLLFVMMLLLAGGVWIGMTLAIVGWIGMAFFTGTPPGKNLFTAFWGSNASWALAALPMFVWMGEILFRTKLSKEMFEGLSPWLNRVTGRERGCHRDRPGRRRDLRRLSRHPAGLEVGVLIL